ncbi:MAG: glutamate-5-semialdehyde dehydrogenase [Chloroflexi bacterium]|nr:glutamate-5-semialdehyde dehydrogenase [Chloroflexota bacterium]
MDQLLEQAKAAKVAARRLAFVPTAVKNAALEGVAERLMSEQEGILAANRIDVEAARGAGLSEAMIDRLLLTADRLRGMAADVRTVAQLPDPVGEAFDERTLPNGLQVGRRRVPIGVVAAIYESRPNVTVDIAVLCLKSGNAIILRGGKEAIHSNRALAGLVVGACRAAGMPEGAVQFVDSPDRELVNRLLQLRELVDLVVPRGGAPLIRFVADNATMPVVTGGIGVCHTYVDAAADIDKATRVVYNAKVRRPTICNALDTLLVHRAVAPAFLPQMARRWGGAGVELRCDPEAFAILAALPTAEVAPGRVVPAVGEDWGQEFLALRAAVRVVGSLDEALGHIETFGSGHSEAIVTEDRAAADRFLTEVDAAAVYVNASTQFTDGGQFGLGAEVGISTQKLHARGPMGLREMTTYKWVIVGDGHARP